VIRRSQSKQTDAHAPAVFEPTTQTSERSQSHYLDRAATGIRQILPTILKPQISIKKTGEAEAVRNHVNTFIIAPASHIVTQWPTDQKRKTVSPIFYYRPHRNNSGCLEHGKDFLHSFRCIVAKLENWILCEKFV
jgi:hypothetical protein